MTYKKSIENDRELTQGSENPFETERALYTKEYEEGDIRVLVTVPDLYPVGFPNIGHQIVEHQINESRGFFASRAYLNSDGKLLEEAPHQKPEIVVISMSYEGSYIRALRVLDELGVPLLAKDRKAGHPLIVIGGRSVSINPLPLFDIADVMGIGDSDEIVSKICAAFKSSKGNREQIFQSLAGEQGVIIPSKYDVEVKDGYLEKWEADGVPEDIEPHRGAVFPHSWYLSSETDYNDIGYYDGKTFFSMEIVKACASKCLFCAEGHNNGRMRFTNDTERIVQLGGWAHEQGADLVKLFFPANSTLDTTKDIVRGLLGAGLKPRVGSAKAEKIDDEYLRLVGRSGQEKIAFAPETGDHQLRNRLGKPGMTNGLLHRVLEESVYAGIPNVDFYFILNLPGEDPSSFARTVEFIDDLQVHAVALGLPGRLRISAPNFFPKAWTPFQYAASGGLDVYEDRLRIMQTTFGDRVKVSNMSGDVDLLSQNIMSRGGNEVGPLMVQVYRRLKAEEEATGVLRRDTFSDWRSAMDDLGIHEEVYFSEKDPEKPLPWHHIKMNGSLSGLRTAWDVFKRKRS